MAIDPTELNQTDKQSLVKIAEKYDDQTFRTAVNAFLERAAQKLEANSEAAVAHPRPIWEEFDEIIKTVPAAEFAKLPADGAEQHDHHIYGLPKKPR